jgi:hypothetical protein
MEDGKMSKALYPITNGKVTLYTSLNYKGTAFEFEGFTVERDAENLFMPYVVKNNASSVDGRKCLNIREYLVNQYKTLADEQLQSYIEQHLNDYGIYELTSNCFSNILKYAGEEPDMNFHDELKLDQVIDGIVGIRINHTVCKYNFADGKPVGYFDDNNKPLPKTPLNVFYGGVLDRLLAVEQYRRGLAPPVYTEFAKLNSFLKGKKSVKLVMKNGSVFDYRNGGDVHISCILSLTARGFTFNNSYRFTSKIANQPVEELDYFQFGKKKYIIDTAALQRFFL